MSNEELVVCIRAGVDTAENMAQLYEQNWKYIHKMAEGYKGITEVEDLEQEAYFGLCDAVERYDSAEGVKFMTYAGHWIRQHMNRYIENHSRTVRISNQQYQRMQKYRKTEGQFLAACGRKPTDKQIACIMGISEKQARELQEQIHMYTMDSTDRVIGEDGDLTIADSVSDHCCLEEEAVDRVAAAEIKVKLWDTVGSLPEKEAEAIRHRYQEGRTLEDTGREMGVNREMVRQYQASGMRKLRCKRDIKQLAENYDIIQTQAYTGGVMNFRRTWTSSTERAALRLYEDA